MSNLVVTVSQLNKYIAMKLKADEKLKGLFIKGEISNFTNHVKTGHYYFTLKDNGSSVKAVMFNNFTRGVKFTPENGLGVIVRANVQVFERDGVYQLYVEDMQPDGIGALYLAYEQLKAKLDAAGLFDPAHKRQIPVMPRKICIITAKTGAAIQDMLTILGRRFPLAEVLLIPTLVQGANAPSSICSALALAQTTGADVIICGRGGGSIEDLWAFNDEAVAHAIYNSAIPVLSAVGHETDFTIADFVADLRAPTPSAAAELAVPDRATLYHTLGNTQDLLRTRMTKRLQGYSSMVDRTYARIAAKSPQGKIRQHTVELRAVNEQMQARINAILASGQTQLQEYASVIVALSPLHVLSRGYSITYKGQTIVKSAAALQNGDAITIRLSEGTIAATVTGIQEEQ